MSVTSMNGHDGNTLLGGAGQDLIYGFDPAGPRRRGDRMTRREVLAAIGGISALSQTALAQSASKPPRIAFVHSGIPAADLTESAGPFWVRRFLQELRRSGYIEGENLIVQRYSAEGHQERFTALAREVVTSKPDLIVMNYNALARAFQDATSTVPLVGSCRPDSNRTCREPCTPGSASGSPSTLRPRRR